MSTAWKVQPNTCNGTADKHVRTSYRKDQPFSRLLNDAMCLPLFDGGNVGVRRRTMEKIFQAADYDPWGAFFS